MPKATRSGIQSVHRALDILSALGSSSPQSIRLLAEAIELPVSTAHGLVSTLVQRGFVVRTPAGYALGPSAASLSTSWDPAVSLKLVLQRATENLAARTGWAGTAIVLAGSVARTLAFAPAPGPITMRANPDQWRAPLAMSTGRLLVALTPKDRWPEFISKARDIEPGWSVQQWNDELDSIHSKGLASRHPKDPTAEASVAMAVIDRFGKPLCAIGCSSPSFLVSSVPDPSIVSELARAATEILQDLGGSPRPINAPD